MIKSKALSLTLSAALIASMAGLAGCGNTNDGNMKTNNISTRDNGRIGVRNQDNNGTQHDLTNLKYSRTLSAKVSKVKGVRDAHVFVTKNNAYVALSLDGQQGGTNNGTNGRMNSMSHRGTGTNGRTDGVYGTSGTGAAGLLRGMTGPRGNTNNMNGLGTNGNYGTYGTYGTGGYGTNGNRTGGYGVRGFDRGMNNTGMLSPGQSGYSMMNTGTSGMMNSVPEHIRHEISNKVQKTVPSCQQVYVSADNDFYNHSARYSTDGSLTGVGRSVSNAVGNTVGTAASDLGSFINRLFPLNMTGQGMMNRDGVTPYNRDGGIMQKDGMFNRTTR